MCSYSSEIVTSSSISSTSGISPSIITSYVGFSVSLSTGTTVEVTDGVFL